MTNLTRRFVLTTGAALALSAPNLARAGLFSDDGPVFSKSGVALRGTDPVAYFTAGAVQKGSKDIATKWMGANWHFASADNRAMFEANPRAFAPQYGGYCAYAVANGYTASTDPDAWTLVDGKLYLNYSLGVQRRWVKDIPGHIASGDANWPDLLAGLTA